MSQIPVTSELVFQTDQAQQNLRGFDNLLLETLRRWSQQSVNLNVNLPNIDQIRRDLDDLLQNAQRATAAARPAGNAGGRITQEDHIWLDPNGRRVGGGGGDGPATRVNNAGLAGWHRDTQHFIAEFGRIARQHTQDMSRVLAGANDNAGRITRPELAPPVGSDDGQGGNGGGGGVMGLGAFARQLRRTSAAGLVINAAGHLAEGAVQLSDAQNIYGGSEYTLSARRAIATEQAVKGMVSGAIPIAGPAIVGGYNLGEALRNKSEGAGFVSEEFRIQRDADRTQFAMDTLNKERITEIEKKALKTYDPIKQIGFRREAAMQNLDAELHANALFWNESGGRLTPQGDFYKRQQTQLIEARAKREGVDTGREESLKNAALGRELRQQQFETGGPGGGNIRLAAQGQQRLAEIRSMREAITRQMEQLQAEADAFAGTDSPEGRRARQRLDAFKQSVPVRQKAISDTENLRVNTSLFQANRAMEVSGMQATGSQTAAAFAGFNSQARLENYNLQFEPDRDIRGIKQQEQRAASAAMLAQADRGNWERNLAAQVKMEAVTRGSYAAQDMQIRETYTEQAKRLNTAIEQNAKTIASGRGIDEKPLAADELNRLKDQQKRLQQERNTLDQQYNADLKVLGVNRQNQLRALDAQNAVRTTSVYSSSFDAQSMAVMARRQTAIDAARPGDTALIARANTEAQLDLAMVNRSRRYRMEDLGAVTGQQHLLRMSGRTAGADTLEMVRQSLRDVNEAGTDKPLRMATADAAKAQLQERMYAAGKFQLTNGAESLWQIAVQQASDKTDVIRAGRGGLRQLDAARNMTDQQIRRERGRDLPDGLVPPNMPGVFGEHRNPRALLGGDRDARDNNHNMGRLAEALEKLIDKLHKHEV